MNTSNSVIKAWPPTEPHSLADRIDVLLPQTQCTQCGYNGCRPYAEAIADGTAEINQCPPGGSLGIVKLAQLLEKSVIPLNPAHGEETPLLVAVIEEAHCIGCTLCIQACPVDAIVGAPKQMHTVLPELCTGCKLCVPPCPVDCIVMDAAGRDWLPQDASVARLRTDARKVRIVREKEENDARLAAKAIKKLAEFEAGIASASVPNTDELRKKATIQAAIERAKLRRAGHAAGTRS